MKATILQYSIKNEALLCYRDASVYILQMYGKLFGTDTIMIRLFTKN